MIQHPFHEQSQDAVSTRLSALHRLIRFDPIAAQEIKVCQVIKELLERTAELRSDKFRLQKRSRCLLRRISGAMYAYQRRKRLMTVGWKDATNPLSNIEPSIINTRAYSRSLTSSTTPPSTRSHKREAFRRRKSSLHQGTSGKVGSL
jgi:hypothetical protein